MQVVFWTSFVQFFVEIRMVVFPVAYAIATMDSL